jgi:glycosyltransferase involved in cell wall biosynthesis
LSYEEAYGLAMIEAKILHRPLIMTHTAAAKEIIINNSTGLIVAQTDEAIYQGLKQLIVNKELRTKFSDNIKGYSFDNGPTYKKLEQLFFN